jgi:asparagine synthetase B (glutamine-hydrolysing)
VLAAYQTLYMVFPQWSRSALTGDPVVEAARDVYFGLPKQFVTYCDTINADGDIASAIFRLNSVLFLSERVLRDTYTIANNQGVEVHLPLVDVDFVESMWSVPVSSRAGNRHSKPFQLELIRPYVHESFPMRKKRGFVLPFDVWMRTGALKAALAATLKDAALAKKIGLEPAAVSALHDNFVDQTLPIPWHSIWSLFVLMRWCEQLDLAI